MRYCVLLITILVSPGCTSLKSRYAMDDPVYAEKYADGAERGDVLGKLKQAMDARHTTGLGGVYLSGGLQVQPRKGNAMGGGELGIEGYGENWLTGRAALSAYGANGEGFFGVDAGMRVQTPSRIAPFAGVGGFVGYSKVKELADDDFIDNDGDMFIDEPGERGTVVDGMLSVVYPEVGIHFWPNGNWRLTTFGRYLISSEGRSQDDWLLGAQMAIFSR